ncbi:MAG: DNA repair protein RecN [Pseudomonadota bacterium]
MLRSLSIRNIVLIETLDLSFGPGLNVMTGETGAGKSILMDALGYALGMKVRRDLLRAGSSEGSVAAEFEIARDHPVNTVLDGAGLDPADGELILRRTASADGRARAFANDQRISSKILSEIGDLLIEVHGQHDDRGLLNPRGHRGLLDAFAGLETATDEIRRLWNAWQALRRELDQAQLALEQSAIDADYLRHSVDELETLAPQPGEDAELDAERRLIRQAADLVSEIGKAQTGLGFEGAEGALSDALSRLSHAAQRAEGRLEPAISAIDRTMAELSEAQAQVGDVLDALTFDPGRLEDVEERLFAIRGLARKHDVAPDDLSAHARAMAARLETIDGGEIRLQDLRGRVETAGAAYRTAAEALTEARRAAAKELDAAVTAELPPLRMEAARFVTDIAVAEDGPEGADAVRFTAQTNPGSPAGPIDRIASGGELSRFLLALKVQLAALETGQVMIFDEIDRGVGGATANAVGRRLSRLADTGQVLVVTHAPQVAAKGDAHFLIAKSTPDGQTRTDVTELDDAARTDEIARMLSGDRITEEARSAARALIDDR